MGNGRLGDLSLLGLECKLMDSISTDEVIDYFEAMKCRKLVFHQFFSNVTCTFKTAII